MFCPYCGKQTPEKGRFCINCGSDISDLFMEQSNEQIVVDDIENSLDIVKQEKSVGTSIATENLKTEEVNLKDDVIEKVQEDKKPKYVVTNLINDNISLLNDERLDFYKKNYFINNEFVFPVGEFFIRYPEHIIMDINKTAYFKYVECYVLADFEKKYLQQVCDMQTFMSEGINLYLDAINQIAEATTRYFVSSGVMIVSENDVKMAINVHSGLENKLNELVKVAESIYSSAQTESEINKLNSMLAQNNTSYMAGGIGFSGVLGGLAAAGIANAGASLFSSLKDSMDKSKIDSKMKKKLDTLFSDKGLLDEFKIDLILCVQDAAKLYCYTMENVYDYTFFGSYRKEEWVCLGDNTIKYITDKATSLENLCKVLTEIYTYSEALERLVILYYKDEEIQRQLSDLAKFLLYDSQLEIWLAKAKKEECLRLKKEKLKKEEQLAHVFALPEMTIEDVQIKINILLDEGNKIGYDSNEKIFVLEKKLEGMKKDEKEAELRKAYDLPENSVDDVIKKMEVIKREAEKINYDVTETITQLQALSEKLKQEEKEVELKKALSLPENTVEEVLEKIDRIKEEAAKIDYDANAQIEQLRLEIPKIEKMVKEREQGEILQKVVIEQNAKGYLIDLLTMLDVEGDKKTQETERFLDGMKCFKRYYKDYLKDEDEIPLLFYDDTWLKSARDSFLVTSKKLLISNMGTITCLNIEDIRGISMVEKTFSPGVLINNKHKIVTVDAGKDKVRPITCCIEAALKVAGILSNVKINFASQLTPEILGNMATITDGSEIVTQKEKANISYQELIEYVKNIINVTALPETHRYYILAGTNDKKYSNAFASYCKLQVGEFPILLFDNTIFGSAKEGFVLTTRGIYFRNSSDKMGFVPYKECDNRVLISEYDIIINGTTINAACASKKESFVEVIEKVIDGITKHVVS